MQGWKTFLVFALISAAGWVEEFTGILKTCGTETIASNAIEVCSLGVPGWAVGAIGLIGIALRAVTKTPIFKKDA